MNWYKAAKKKKNTKDVHPTDWVHVDSSFISAVAYNEDLGFLEVRMKSGRDYLFDGVPKKTYDAFMDADSKGRFFNEVIKKRYNRQASCAFNLYRKSQNEGDPNAVNDWFSFTIVNNPNSTPEELTRLIDGYIKWRKDRREMFPNRPPAIYGGLEVSPSHILSAAIRHPNTPGEVLGRLIMQGGGTSGEFNGVVSDPRVPSEAVEYVVKGFPKSKAAKVAAKHPNCPPELLEKALSDFIASGEDTKISEGAAANRKSPPELLAKIVDTDNWSFTYANACANLSTPIEAILKAAESSHYNVSLGAVRNSRFPLEAAETLNIHPLVFEVLVKKSTNNADNDLRNALISNPNFPIDEFAQKLSGPPDMGGEYRAYLEALKLEKTPQELKERIIDNWRRGFLGD